jgi:hypothetical protein
MYEYFWTSGQFIGPNFKGQGVQEEYKEFFQHCLTFEGDKDGYSVASYHHKSHNFPQN